MARTATPDGDMESYFCKYQGKPRRISKDHASRFKIIQNTYKETIEKALRNLNPGKLASQEYLLHDTTVNQISKGAAPVTE